MKSEDPEPQKRAYAKYFRYYHVGFEFALAVGLLTFGGYWLDQWLGMEPLFTLLGLALGFAVGFRALYMELYGDEKGRGGTRGAARREVHRMPPEGESQQSRPPEERREPPETE